jgi:hypothetical protein
LKISVKLATAMVMVVVGLTGCKSVNEVLRTDITELDTLFKEKYWAVIPGATPETPLAQAEGICKTVAREQARRAMALMQSNLNNRFKPLPKTYTTEGQCIHTGAGIYSCSGTTTGGVDPIVQSMQNAQRGMHSSIGSLGVASAARGSFTDCMKAAGYEQKYR